MESQKETGLGNLLKTERENKGFSLERVAGITRLRVHFIEALENEDWEKLPARAFIKGFIRSYARAIGLDAEEAVRVFNNAGPAEEILPKPLGGVKKKKKKLKYIVPLIVLIIVLGLLFILLPKTEMLKKDLFLPVETQEEKEVSLPDQDAEKEIGVQAPELLPMEETLQQQEVESVIVNEEITVENDIIPAVVGVESAVSSGQPDSVEAVAPDTKKFTLTGIVNMTTYVRIYIDDNTPREYMFRPGSRPQWTAEKGFDIIVGNAAGIEFDFNGEKITDIGEFGKVKRLNFPENFKSELYEN